jgi:hypothetical protein
MRPATAAARVMKHSPAGALAAELVAAKLGARSAPLVRDDEVLPETTRVFSAEADIVSRRRAPGYCAAFLAAADFAKARSLVSSQVLPGSLHWRAHRA